MRSRIRLIRQREEIVGATSERECVRRRVLVENLVSIRIGETERNSINIIDRSGFSAVLLFQCLDAIDSHTLRLSGA
ncbi:DUF6471 domain-containing protein [Methylobacterium nigriterrae]|uniref:DUF6471 domain-containing protein n=1 Tax=Methylobacterium nigriterrae TaxID=3127512 RepID=UPI003D67D7DE